MKVLGYAAQQAKAPLSQYSFERREPNDNDVVIDIQYCDICHTDIHQVNDEWGGKSTYPMVPGHEITGMVTEVSAKIYFYGIRSAYRPLSEIEAIVTGCRPSRP